MNNGIKILIIVTALVVCFSFFRLVETVTAIPKASFQVTVCDTVGTPLKDATVFLLNTEEYFVTDDNGESPVIVLPFALDGEWFGVTIFVYCKGYVDTAVFNLTVYKNRHRNGPRIRLFVDDGSMPKATIYTENPPDEYAYRLIEAHRP